MNIIELQCYKCQSHFQIPRKEYNRQIKNGRQYFFCSLACSHSYNKKRTFELLTKCIWCQHVFQTTTHKKARKCCSNECARKYAQSKVNPIKHKQSVQRLSHFPKEKQFKCIICHNTFKRRMSNNVELRKTCSKECYRQFVSQWTRNNSNCGGVTNYKKYKYNEVWMDSNWEIKLAKWLDKNQIKWIRDRKICQFLWTDNLGIKRRYYPDFYLPQLNVYLDPKNKYLIEKDKDKIKRVIKENKIILFWGLLENVQKEIENFIIC